MAERLLRPSDGPNQDDGNNGHNGPSGNTGGDEANGPETRREPRPEPPLDALGPAQGGPAPGDWNRGVQLRHALTHALGDAVDWLRADTYVPEWLPRPLRHKRTGYLAAVVAQVIAALLTVQLMALLPAFALQSALAYLGVVFAAALFGAGPGVVGTIAAAVLLDYIVLPPHFDWRMNLANLVNILLYLLVGFTTTVLITQLLQALRIANAATQRMEELLSITSHELRTPLSAIKASVQLAERRISRLADEAAGVPSGTLTGTPTGTPTSATPEARSTHPTKGATTPHDVLAALETADRQVEALDALIADLLDTSRIRTGQMRLKPRRLDLVALVREVVEDQRAMHPDRLIELELPPSASSEPSATVYADPARIAQVISNYITNALKYSPADQPVTIGLALAGASARVWVRDHGPGLPPEQHGRVWEMFYRAPGIKARGGPRTSLGLGLPISRSIVERHGGEVGLQSAPGRGSTFSFTLPLAR